MAKQKVEAAEAPEATEEKVPEVALIDTDIGKAFKDHIDSGTEDEVKMQMIAAGSTFKNVTRQFNELMISTGRAMSKADRDEVVESICADADLSTEEGFDAAVAEVMDEATGVNDKSAAASIRAWARKNEVDVWKKPKGEGKTGFAADFYNFLRGEARTDEASTAFIQGTDGHAETSANTKNHQSHYLAIHKLVQDIRNGVTA